MANSRPSPEGAVVAVDGDGGDAAPEELRARQTNWLAVGIFLWLVNAISVNEHLDPPFESVRVLVRLVLAGTMAWFLSWIFTAARRLHTTCPSSRLQDVRRPTALGSASSPCGEFR